MDGGTGRGGLNPAEPTLNFAIKIGPLPGLNIVGLLYYGGTIYDANTEELLVEKICREHDELVNTANLLMEHGFHMAVLSAGSSFSAKRPQYLSGITEVRAGHYIFNDCGQLSVGLCKEEDCALRVISTVVSKPDAYSAIADAGTKSLTSDTCHFRNGYGHIVGHPEIEMNKLNEEHAFFAHLIAHRPFNWRQNRDHPQSCLCGIQLGGSNLWISRWKAGTTHTSGRSGKELLTVHQEKN